MKEPILEKLKIHEASVVIWLVGFSSIVSEGSARDVSKLEELEGYTAVFLI